MKVTLEATDDGYVQTVWQRLDSGNWAIYPYGGVSVASNGRHVLEYYAIDIANNRETTRSLDIWIDADPPSPSISGISPTHSTDGSATISWGTSDAGSGLANTVLWVDGVSRGYSEGLSGTLTISGLPDGTHNVTVVSTDGAGNVGMAYSSFTVDTSYLSPTGPYGPYLLVSFIVTLCAAAVALFLLRKRIR